MLQAILFDNDGVLVDTERLFFDATRAAFATVGVELGSAQWAKWYLAEGKRTREIARLLGVPPADVEPAIARRDEMFWESVDRGAPVFPGVEETLGRLAAHFRLGIVTGASRRHFDRVHSSTGLGDFFEFAVTCENERETKPNPRGYLTALGRLSLDARECLAVEDSPRGARAALSAGIPCVVIPTRLTDLALCPPHCKIIDDIAQLAEFAAAVTVHRGLSRFSRRKRLWCSKSA
ncbi:MAG: HAD family phosphatase [Pirellulales bacterium]|nr:HAD family phosphatase [Pirellulales bacterium]